MEHTYTITLANDDNGRYTAYQGNSHTNAQKAIDTLRAALILSSGTAGIYASYWGRNTQPIWQVTAGAAAFANMLEVK